MACPFFFPTEKFDDKAWRHRPQLPLGDGFLGICRRDSKQEFIPDARALQACCNLGYAFDCPRFPRTYSTDAVRLAVVGDTNSLVTIYCVLEKDHRPAEHGKLEYSAAERQFLSRHRDPIVERQAEVYVESYFRRKGGPARPAHHSPGDARA
ncbi:MAG TPA: hypothetical protein VIH17_05310 [Candidatus Acidoferrales bacterium]